MSLILLSTWCMFSYILPWHVANQLSSLTAYIPINRCPSPVLGHHPFLVKIEYIFKYGPVKETKNSLALARGQWHSRFCVSYLLSPFSMIKNVYVICPASSPCVLLLCESIFAWTTWTRFQAANSYRPGKNGFSKQQNRIGIGPANTLKYINIVNGPGGYIHTIKQRQWPQQFKNKTGPENSWKFYRYWPILVHIFIFFINWRTILPVDRDKPWITVTMNLCLSNKMIRIRNMDWDIMEWHQTNSDYSWLCIRMPSGKIPFYY